MKYSFVTPEDFVAIVLKELSTLKYIYDENIVGCIKAVQIQHRVRCMAPVDELVQMTKNALSSMVTRHYDPDEMLYY